MKVTVLVKRKEEIADPQGSTVARALRDLGYEEVADVRVDKTITLEIGGLDPQEARARASEMCEKLLANPVMESYEVVIEP